jgi:hypothetical protein
MCIWIYCVYVCYVCRFCNFSCVLVVRPDLSTMAEWAVVNKEANLQCPLAVVS